MTNHPRQLFEHFGLRSEHWQALTQPQQQLVSAWVRRALAGGATLPDQHQGEGQWLPSPFTRAMLLGLVARIKADVLDSPVWYGLLSFVPNPNNASELGEPKARTPSVSSDTWRDRQSRSFKNQATRYRSLYSTQGTSALDGLGHPRMPLDRFAEAWRDPSRRLSEGRPEDNLLQSFQSQLQRCMEQFEMVHEAYRASSNTLPTSIPAVDVTTLVDDIDALSCAGAGLAWELSVAGSFHDAEDAERCEAALTQLQLFLTRVGNRADCLVLGLERLEAIASLISDEVLAEDPFVRIRQWNAQRARPRFDQCVLQSARWVGQALSRVRWTASNMRPGELPTQRSGPLSTPVDPSEFRNALMSISGALASRSAGSSSANELAVMAARILLAASSRFATDDSAPRPTLLWRWSSRGRLAVRRDRNDEQFRATVGASRLLPSSPHVDRHGISPDFEAHCLIESGATTALIRFVREDVPDRSLDGASVEWCDQSVVVDQGCARFELDHLRRAHERAHDGLVQNVVRSLMDLRVDGQEWILEGLAVSEGPNSSHEPR